ncbi:MAG: hypothetical protein K2O73_09885 [Lachnospiraceae bacterium]|nr:hypothetical protein [Lachnospiraceae bacterium]MDE7435266.1 hypothetical protein [Lachnospiraceae bacterium]
MEAGASKFRMKITSKLQSEQRQPLKHGMKRRRRLVETDGIPPLWERVCGTCVVQSSKYVV